MSLWNVTWLYFNFLKYDPFKKQIDDFITGKTHFLTYKTKPASQLVGGSIGSSVVSQSFGKPVNQPTSQSVPCFYLTYLKIYK